MPQTVTEEQSSASSGRGVRFINNVLWSWLGVAASLSVGLILSPYIIRKLGEERYGIWALVFSIIDYFWFFDLGLNTAVTNFCARYLAEDEKEKINEVINTALFYFSIISFAIIGSTIFLSKNVEHFFHVSPAYQKEFSTLILITGISWGLCIVLHMFVSALDGFQRFDLTSRVSVFTIILRSAGSAWLLKMGYGLVEMGILFVSCQVLGYVLNFFNFRKVFGALRFSPALVKLSVFRQIVRYGLHSFLASSSTLTLNQSGPVLIGHFLPTAFVGYYALPARLLQYAVDGVSRIALVTRSSAAELKASGRNEAVLELGIYSNRYSFTLFTPLVLVLLVFGSNLIRLWVGPEFAKHSAPLLPILLLATAFAMAGQFNSSALLFGLGKHDGYARLMLIEAVANVAGLFLVIPRYQIIGAAWVSCSLMLLFRGLLTPWLVCRSLDFPFLTYMHMIYLRPLLAALPVLALAYASKRWWISGETWMGLILISTILGSLYVVLAFFVCVARKHRHIFLSRIPILGGPLRARFAS